MTARRRSLFVVLAVAVIALVAVAVVVAGNLFTAPTTSTAADQPAPPPEAAAVAPQALPAQPVHVPAGQPPGTVRLPQGGTAELVRKEIDRSGTLPVPDGVDEATWWGAGLDAPKGATVLAGHVNWKGAIGPFEELWEAETGQPVTVVDDAGKEWRYQVSEVVTVHKDDLPARARDLFGQGGEHRLVLVTCGGRYVGGDLGYDENRIVIATPA
ncbi:Sortase family protein [Saccharopolyspora antimicrobica]|uniref:Sortase family protein n=1 Tax=Saccharopolyspora antimicrobica TaxID=455193 RepID=A0A1I4ZRA4_9PSEU|nr:class F sortase [Saccharopolyspora antimicrobica]RKT83431.1 sortase family protein [Saccharopolyspora antimicrobica]SFN52791.1 Sortase family protein [Saccharopolyspora antimicrobica]